MLMEQATTVRKEWSAVCDSVIHEKPKFIKRTRDKMWFSSLDTMSEILAAYKFTADKYIEPDGSITLSLGHPKYGGFSTNDIPLVPMISSSSTASHDTNVPSAIWRL